MLLTLTPLLACALAIAVLASTGAAGLIPLFLLPGVWAYLRLAPATFSAALDRQAPYTALRTSIARTRPVQWPLTIAWMLGLLLILMVASIVSGIFIATLGNHGGSLALIGVVQKMLGALLTVLLFLAWRGQPPDAATH